MKNSFGQKIFLVISFCLLFNLTPTRACDQTTITITGQVNNGDGTYTFTLNICFGVGVGGGSGDTDNWSIKISGGGATIASFTPGVTCSNTGSAYTGASTSTTEVVYSGPGKCACIAATCGAIGTACQTVTITTNGVPTSFQLKGAEQNSAASPPANGTCPTETATPAPFPAPVPIELLKFTGVCKNNEIKLSWSTASEINSDYFTIEKSIDGKFFEVLTTTAAAGSSSQLNEYSITDNTPIGETGFYRLSQTDFNNTTKYFSLVSVNNCKKKDPFFLSAASNPSLGRLDIRYTSDDESEVSINIVDVTGQLKYKQQFSVQKGFNNLNANIDQLNSGLYILLLSNSSKAMKTKFVKE